MFIWPVVIYGLITGCEVTERYMRVCTEIQRTSIGYFRIRGPQLKEAKCQVNFPLGEGKSFYCMINVVLLKHQNNAFLGKIGSFLHRFTFLDLPIDWEETIFIRIKRIAATLESKSSNLLVQSTFWMKHKLHLCQLARVEIVKIVPRD